MKNNKLVSNKLVTAFFIAMTILIAVQPQSAFAAKASTSAPIKSVSASLTQQPQKPEKDYRVNLLRAYLESYKSPLADEADTFVIEADKYNIDYRLLPAMAGVESWFGTR